MCPHCLERREGHVGAELRAVAAHLRHPRLSQRHAKPPPDVVMEKEL
jgi:hypothetical protein